MSAWDMGCQAWYEEKETSANPFEFGTENHKQWNDGWWQMHHEEVAQNQRIYDQIQQEEYLSAKSRNFEW